MILYSVCLWKKLEHVSTRRQEMPRKCQAILSKQIVGVFDALSSESIIFLHIIATVAASSDREMAPYPSGKRKFDAIDLTGDDDVRSSTQAHRAPPGDVTQSQRDSWLEQGDEADAEDIILSSQDGDDSVTQSYQLYGMLRIGTRLTTPY